MRRLTNFKLPKPKPFLNCSHIVFMSHYYCAYTYIIILTTYIILHVLETRKMISPSKALRANIFENFTEKFRISDYDAYQERDRNLDKIGGGHLLRFNDIDNGNNGNGRLNRNLDSIGLSNFVRNLDHIGGGHLIRNIDSDSYMPNESMQMKRNLDSNGGANLIKRTIDSIGGANLIKRTLDSIGGAHLLKRSVDPLGGGFLLKK